MTPRQMRILVALAMANVALVLMVFLVLRFPALAPLEGLPSPVPTYGGRGSLSPACEGRITDSLSQAGLGGTAGLIGGTLDLDLIYHVREQGLAKDPGQKAWQAFDVVRVFAESGCGTFSRVEMTLTPQGNSVPPPVHVTLETDDLRAFHAGELTEDGLIERVDYQVGAAAGNRYEKGAVEE